ncbi:MAG: hypothetical protein QM820_03525 [Minicystis sp.]
MFDYYEPGPVLRCPQCGSDLAGWQGKDGPCNLVVWQQGVLAPTHQEVNDELRLARDQLAQLRLPAVFGLYAECPCKLWVTATGFCRSDTWAETALGTAQTRDAVPAWSFGDSLRHCSGCAHVWSTGGTIALAVCPACAKLTELAKE